MSKRCFAAVVVLLGLLVSSLRASEVTDQSSKVLNILKCTTDRTEVKQFEKFEINLDIQGDWDNPFDPEDISVVATIQTPSGKNIKVDGFFYRDYEVRYLAEMDYLASAGSPRWKVRFAPSEIGPHIVGVRVHNKGRQAEAAPIRFDCLPGQRHGFLRVSSRNPRYFAFDDGSPFFAIGNNIGMPARRSLLSTRRGCGMSEYDAWMERLAANGGNFVRVFWCFYQFDLQSGDFGLQIAPAPDSDAGKGPERINLESAWWIDRTVNKAEDLGLFLMCCFETHSTFSRRWKTARYNRANGGPLSKPEEFFTNDEAKKLFKRRLRYAVARWGYSTAVGSWQLLNEYSAFRGFDLKTVTPWHAEMARYLKQVDPYDHLVHTNCGHLNGFKQVDGLPEIDIVSTNIYHDRDAALTADWTRTLARRYKKPYLLSEYGTTHYCSRVDLPLDPKGIMLNNAIWGQAVSGSAGTGMAWWWEVWIDRYNLYDLYDHFSDFVREIAFDRYEWRPLQVVSFSFSDPNVKSSLGASFVEGWTRNFFPTPLEGDLPVFTVAPDGAVSPSQRELLMALTRNVKELTGSSRSLSRHYGPKTFRIIWPADGRCTVYVPEIDERAKPILKVSADGMAVLEEPLAITETRRRFPGAEYFKEYSFPVIKGEHLIRIENTGTRWFAFALGLENHRIVNGPDLQVRGMQSADWILLWLRHPKFNWHYDRMGVKPTPQPAGRLALCGVSAGRYRTKWIDTMSGAVLKEGLVEAADGSLLCDTPPVAASAACLMRRMH